MRLQRTRLMYGVACFVLATVYLFLTPVDCRLDAFTQVAAFLGGVGGAYFFAEGKWPSNHR